MAILQAIYDTGLAQSMRESLWGYPIALTFHSIGMGILVGALTVMDLRILGIFRNMPVQVLRPIIWIALFGFVVNLISGLLLFVADAVSYATNPAFLVKIACVIVGVILLWVTVRTKDYRALQEAGGTAVGNPTLKVLAAVSLLIWLIAIISGRLIGYMM